MESIKVFQCPECSETTCTKAEMDEHHAYHRLFSDADAGEGSQEEYGDGDKTREEVKPRLDKGKGRMKEEVSARCEMCGITFDSKSDEDEHVMMHQFMMDVDDDPIPSSFDERGGEGGGIKGKDKVVDDESDSDSASDADSEESEGSDDEETIEVSKPTRVDPWLAQRSVLERIYAGTSPESRRVAEKAYPWYLRCFAELGDFEKYFKISGVSESCSGFLEPSTENNCQSLSPSVTSRYRLDDRDLSGVEIILALSFDLNDRVRSLIDATDTSTNIPLPRDSLAQVGSGDARVANFGGCYCLQDSNGCWIVGSASCSTLKQRLNRPVYSTSKKVLSSFPDGDQRYGRTDRILFDGRALDVYGYHFRWLNHAIESIAIVLFGSTLQNGLNTNVVDRRRIISGRNLQQIHTIWLAVHVITQTDRIPAFDRGAVRFKTWFERHVTNRFPFETPEAWYRLVRNIASEIKAGPISHFDALPDTVWEGRVPRLRIKGNPIFDMSNKIHSEYRIDYRVLDQVIGAQLRTELSTEAPNIVDDIIALDPRIIASVPAFKTSRGTGMTKLRKFEPSA